MTAVELFLDVMRHTADDAADPGIFARLAQACTYSLSVDGVAISARTTPQQLQLMTATSERASRLEDLQVMLGEGPSIEAFRSDGLVLVADLSSVERWRWPAFEAGLHDGDCGGLFALPLHLGAIRLGVLCLYRDAPGLLVDGDLAGALNVCDAVTRTLLMTGEHAVGDGSGISILGGSENSNEVNQATGMVIAQLGVTAEEAYVRLRSYAFSLGRPLGEVAADFVHGQLRLEGPDTSGRSGISST